MPLLKWHNTGNTFVLSDFDRTESCHWETTPGVFASYPDVPRALTEARVALYEKYRAIEIDTTIDQVAKASHMMDWHEESARLIQEHITYDIFQEIKKYACEAIVLRENVRNAKLLTQEHWVPWITYSAWFAEIIEAIMEHNGISDSVVHWNRLGFHDNGRCTGITNRVPIFNENKVWWNIPKNIQESVADRTHIILLWDAIHDVNMAPKDRTVLSVWFLVSDQQKSRRIYQETFDRIVESDTWDSWILWEITQELLEAV